MRALAVLRGRKSCGPRWSHCALSSLRTRRLCAAAFAFVILAPASAQETINYTYDSRGRLTNVNHGTTGPNANVVSSYTYDAADNRCNVTVTTNGTTGTGACTAGGGGGGTSPSFSINNASGNEGTSISFTVTRSGDTSGTDTVQYSTSNGTATAGSDYTAKSLTTLTFNPGVGTQPISVTTLQDTAVEGGETFNINLSNASAGTTITDSLGVGTIVDDDTAPTCNGVSFSVSSSGAVYEGGPSVFAVTKSGSTSTTCSVNYTTVDGTAKAPGDYTATSGTLAFASLTTSKNVSVPTVDDTTAENAETVKLSISNATNGATIGTATATGTINDNDSGGTCGGVSFSVNNVTAVEGSPLVFTVSKSGTTSSSCSVSYATANGTATAGALAAGDYVAASGTLTFTSGQTAQTVSITTKGDFSLEVTEAMYLNLSGASPGATISDPQGVGSIQDDGTCHRDAQGQVICQ